MTNLKSITELPVAESAEGLNLIVNDNGAAKQIAASEVGAQADFAVTDETSPAFIKNKPAVAQADWNEVDESSPAFIKNKPHKELMYEWNFNVDDEVFEILENVNDDLTWLTEKSDNIGWEIVAETYAQYNDGSSDVIDSSFISTMITTDSSYLTGYHSNQMLACSEIYAPKDYNDWSKSYFAPYCEVQVYNKVNFNFDNGEATPVDIGGVFILYGSPFKSVKIYKIIR